MLLLWLLVGLVAGVLILAAVPVELTLRVERHGGQGKAAGTVLWLFGAARIRLGDAKRRVRAARGRSTLRRQARRRGAARLTAMICTEQFPSRLLRLAHESLRCIRIRELTVHARVGLDDPADTGWLWAVVAPLAGTLAILPGAHIAIEPQFTCAAFDFDMRSRIRLIPLQLLFTVLIFALSPGTLRALRAARAAP